jgi:hypothetical protein
MAEPTVRTAPGRSAGSAEQKPDVDERGGHAERVVGRHHVREPRGRLVPGFLEDVRVEHAVAGSTIQ